MKETLYSMLAGAGGVLIATPLVVYLVKMLFGKALDHFFKKAQDSFGTRLELAAEIAAKLAAKEIDVYPALSEIVYRAKTGVDEVAKTTTPCGLQNAEVTQACRTLTTTLHAYRIYLDDDLFTILHQFKHKLQDIMVITDTYTRKDYLLKTGDVALPEEATGRIAPIAADVSELCTKIVVRMRERMKHLSDGLT